MNGDALEYINDSAKAMADKMIAISVRYRLPLDLNWKTIWESYCRSRNGMGRKKDCYLLPEQEEYRTVFENQGWAVITDCTELAITIFEGRNS